MIAFDLRCAAGHVFEGWFRSSADYDRQAADRLIPCPTCGSADVTKAVMAPHVGRKGNQRAVAPAVDRPAADSGPASASVPMMAAPAAQPALPPEVAAVLARIAEAQARALPQSTWVGEEFADKARAMHRGDADPALIHGAVSSVEAEALADEGVPVMPLLVPVVPPKLQN